MCLYYGKYLWKLFREDTGSLVFGILSSVFTFTAFIISLVIVLFSFVYLPVANDLTHFIGSCFNISTINFIHLQAIFSVAAVKFFIDCLFSVFLSYGVWKKIPSYLTVYLVYGLGMVLMDTAVIILAFRADAIWSQHDGAGRILLAYLILYCLILHMINMARKKISKETQILRHSHLIEAITHLDVQSSPQQTNLDSNICVENDAKTLERSHLIENVAPVDVEADPPQMKVESNNDKGDDEKPSDCMEESSVTLQDSEKSNDSEHLQSDSSICMKNDEKS